jgi:hypothetical protein
LDLDENLVSEILANAVQLNLPILSLLIIDFMLVIGFMGFLFTS